MELAWKSCLGLILLTSATAFAQAEYPGATWVRSPNYRASGGRPIDLVVIHTTEGSYAGAIQWFQNPRAQVSAHYVVSPEGRVTQMVHDRDVAWHARSAGNTTGIGIECAGYSYRRSTWTEPLLRALAKLTRWECDRHHIPVDRGHIKGHYEIPGNDHTDPGPYFPWARFIAMVKAAGRSPAPSPAPAPAPAPAPSPSPSPAAASAPVFEVTASALNVRGGPGLGAAVIGRASRGQRVAVHARQGDWAAVSWGGREAWVSSSYLRRLPGTPSAEVRASGLNVRAGPSTSATILAVAPRGAAYPVLERRGDWVRVQLDERGGWACVEAGGDRYLALAAR